MNYYNKNNLPENLSSLNDVSKNYDKTVNEFIIYLIKTNKINEDKVKFIFNEYFSKKINNKIKKKNYTNLILKLLDQLLPILLNQKHPKQASFQLLRLLDHISPNFEYLEKIIQKTFVYNTLSEILSFSGHITNLLSKDDKLLEVLDPYYSLRLSGNIIYYKNEFEKIQYLADNEEIILNKLRKVHRSLKFQIIVSVITNQLKIEKASYEFSILARATIEKTIEIALHLMNKKTKLAINFLEETGVLAYGRLANNTMTSNSDLDLVFIFPDKSTNFKETKEYFKFYKNFSKKIINILSAKTSEGILYEVDTKLLPSENRNDLACKQSEFINFHKKSRFFWERIALIKSDIIFKNSSFQKSLVSLVDKMKSKDINLHGLLKEIKSMRGLNSNSTITSRNFHEVIVEKNIINWYETKYSLGGQRDIEFLEYIYKINLIKRRIVNVDNKKLFINKAKNFYFVLDQFINITFSLEKPENLTDKVVIHLINYLNIRDLGNLKKIVKDTKNEINNFLLEVLIED